MIQSALEKWKGRKQTLIQPEMNVIFKSAETYLHKQTIYWSSWVQCSLCASAHHVDSRQTLALQCLSDKPYTSASCPAWTLFPRPASVEERVERATGFRKQKHDLTWSLLERNKNVKYVVKLTQMTLCRMSSAWLSAFCNLAIRLWCKVSLRDPIKNWESSWTDQESGRSWMTFSATKDRGLLLSRSAAALARSSELR